MHYAGIPTLKHRDGGISHGNKRGSSKALESYFKDWLIILKKEYLPNAHLLDSKGKKGLEDVRPKRKQQYLEYIGRRLRMEKSIVRKSIIRVRHPWILLLSPASKKLPEMVPVIKNVLNKISDMSVRHTLIPGFYVGALLLLLYEFINWEKLIVDFGDRVGTAVGYCGLVMIGLCMVLCLLKITIRIIRRFYRNMKS